MIDGYARMLAALGHEARLEIFRWLVRCGPAGSCVDDIRTRLGMPGSTLSHHLNALQSCGLIEGRREQRFIYYMVDWARTGELLRFLTEDCCAETGCSTARAAGERGRKTPAKTTARRAT